MRFSLICPSCPFQNLSYDQKHTLFSSFAPLNDVRAYIAWSWKTTLITWIFLRGWYPTSNTSGPPPSPGWEENYTGNGSGSLISMQNGACTLDLLSFAHSPLTTPNAQIFPGIPLGWESMLLPLKFDLITHSLGKVMALLIVPKRCMHACLAQLC